MIAEPVPELTVSHHFLRLAVESAVMLFLRGVSCGVAVERASMVLVASVAVVVVVVEFAVAKVVSVLVCVGGGPGGGGGCCCFVGCSGGGGRGCGCFCGCGCGGGDGRGTVVAKTPRSALPDLETRAASTWYRRILIYTRISSAVIASVRGEAA